MEPQIIRPSSGQPEPSRPADQEASVTIDHTQAAPAPTPVTSAPQPVTLPAPVAAPAPEPVVADQVASAQPQEQQTPWQYSGTDEATTTSQPSAPDTSTAHISWSASEFIAYHKSAGWYIQVFLALVVVAGVAYFLTRDLITTVSIMIIGIIFLVFAGRKPRVLNYGIDDDGVRIGDKLYAFGAIRSFAVIDEGQFHSITLLPLQRFMPSISMYYEPQDEDKIVDVLGSYLPMEDRKQDAIDRFMHKIRF